MATRYCERLDRLTGEWASFDMALLVRGDIFRVYEDESKQLPVKDNLDRVVLVAANDAFLLEPGNAGVETAL